MKIKSIKLKDYFELKKPQYTYVKITPDKSIRNYNSTNIAKAISHTWKNINKRIYKEKKKFFFETNFKISYIIDIQNNNANFYFVIPKSFLTVLLEKIREIWPKATIEEVEGIQSFSSDSITYQLVYKKEDALSINVDKKSNEPLNSILNVIEIMNDDDRVTIVYNFLPRTQFGWLKQYSDTMDKIKGRKPLEREKLNVAYIGKSLLSYVIDLLESFNEVLNDFIGGSTKINNQLSFRETLATALEQNKEISPATKRKKELRVIDTQIAVVSSSVDDTRKDNNALAVCQSYRVLDEDNELIYKKAKETPEITDYKFASIETNTVTTDESQNFIQIPGRQLLRQFGIKHIEVNENAVPEKLRQGYISLGKVTCKGAKVNAYLEDEYNIGSLPLVLVGAQGSGKSTFISNYFSYINQRKEGGLLLDYIKNCELAEDVSKVIPKEDRVVLDLSSEEDIQGLGFNEIKITDDMTTYQKLKYANLQAQQTMSLIDAINLESPLSSQMRRFLAAASNVVYAAGYTSIRDVINCLEDHRKRHMYIDSLNEELLKSLEDEINDLLSLDELSKPTKENPVSEVIGTKASKIEHILDRVNLLKEDFKLKYMFNKDTSNNIDLVELMEQGKIVIIKMPQAEFPTKMIKNVLITYWVCKMWLSSQIRGGMNAQPKRTHTVIDEVFQAPTSMGILEYILPQSRKFGCKLVFSTQYIEQIEKIEDSLKASGSSYMFLKGTKEDDFKKFESDLEGFEYEDLRDMGKTDMNKRFSLNLVYYSGGYSSFISALPPPVK